MTRNGSLMAFNKYSKWFRRRSTNCRNGPFTSHLSHVIKSSSSFRCNWSAPFLLPELIWWTTDSFRRTTNGPVGEEEEMEATLFLLCLSNKVFSSFRKFFLFTHLGDPPTSLLLIGYHRPGVVRETINHDNKKKFPGSIKVGLIKRNSRSTLLRLIIGNGVHKGSSSSFSNKI